MTRRSPTHVYVAHGRYGYKIGIAVDVAARLRILRSETQAPVRRVKSWRRPNDARIVEYDAHHSLKGPRDWWDRDYEWFDVSEQVAIEAVEAAIARAKAGTSIKARCRVERERREASEREFAAEMKRWREEAEAYAATLEQE